MKVTPKQKSATWQIAFIVAALRKHAQQQHKVTAGLQLPSFILCAGVLQKLLSLQALDEHDIEGIYPLYQHVLQQLKASSADCTTASAEMHSSPASEKQTLDALQPCEAYVHQLLGLGWSEQMKILQNYLLATTAKDCSLMIALQAIPQANLQLRKDSNAQLQHEMSSQELVSSPALTHPLQCKLTIVDLDRKPHAKIDVHHCLDQQIMCHLQQRPV